MLKCDNGFSALACTHSVTGSAVDFFAPRGDDVPLGLSTGTHVELNGAECDRRPKVMGGFVVS
jgi:hypothetical protein